MVIEKDVLTYRVYVTKASGADTIIISCFVLISFIFIALPARYNSIKLCKRLFTLVVCAYNDYTIPRTILYVREHLKSRVYGFLDTYTPAPMLPPREWLFRNNIPPQGFVVNHFYYFDLIVIGGWSRVS